MSVRDTHRHAQETAKRVISLKRNAPILILLKGPLGAGKTEWVRGFVKAYLKNKNATVTSPTYSVVNMYEDRGRVVYHVDLYRLKGTDDLESVGFWDLFTGRNLVIVEWGDLLQPVWPRDISILSVTISIEGDEKRRIEVSTGLFGSGQKFQKG